MARLLIWIIKGYQTAVSPWLGPCCRFYPSCSSYWVEALTKYGCRHGLWLGIKRLSKCHPFHPGGVDAVP